MKQVIIGKNADTGEDVRMDLEKLMEGGLAMLAGPGGGKTNEIKVICEATHSDVLATDALQHIIMDWEGDLVTLAENYDYLVAERIESGDEGKKKRIHADPKNAAVMARKTLELNLNLIVDLSSLPVPQRRLFAKNFLEALVYTPKDLWNRQCIVVIDEAHEVAPEKGYGDQLALNAVVDLMSLGRKRGLRGILASQRPARLAKDALTQVRNKMIGLASWEADQKVMARELGWTTLKEQKQLEELDHEFYVVGPAISKKLIKIKSPRAKSRPLKFGSNADFKPMETGRAAKMLSEFNDLSVKADQELRTVDDYKRKNSELVHKNAQLEYQLKQNKPAIDPAAVQQTEQRGYLKGKQEGKQKIQAMRARLKTFEDGLKTIETISGNISAVAQNIGRVISSELQEEKDEVATIPVRQLPLAMPKAIPTSIPSTSQPPLPIDSNGKPLNAGQKKILQFLALRPDKFFTKSQIGTMTGYAPASGTFGTYLSDLKTKEYIEQSGQTFRLKALPEDMPPSSFTDPMAALTDWLNKMGNGGQKRIFEKILEDASKEWTKEELAAEAGFEPNSGTYGTYLSNLATLTLIVKDNGKIRLNPELLSV